MTRRKVTEYDWWKLRFDEMIMRIHMTRPRRLPIRYCVAHHSTVVGKGNGAANSALYNIWQKRQASAHYGVDGKYVMQLVWDDAAAWAAGNYIANHSGLHVEHANLKSAPTWAVDEVTWKTGAKLMAFLHIFHGLGRPTSKLKGFQGTLRKHKAFFATACPGPYFDKIWPQYVAEAQRQYDAATKPSAPSAPVKPGVKPPKQLKRYYRHVHINSWGDSTEGAKTIAKRIPVMCKDALAKTTEVVTINEVRSNQVPMWKRELAKYGFAVHIAEAGNIIALHTASIGKVKAKKTFFMKNQGLGRKEAVSRLAAQINGHWQGIATGHFDYRPEKELKGADKLRVKMGHELVSSVKYLAGIAKLPTWKTRVSIGVDDNSDSWVRSQAFEPAGLPAAVQSKLVKIYSARPTIDTDVISSETDHKIIAATFGKK